MFKRNRLSVFLILVLLLCFLTACGQEQADLTDNRSSDATITDDSGGDGTSDNIDDPNVLRIITEQSAESTINDLVKDLIDEYEGLHEGITIELEILPKNGEEREVRLDSLRTEIMSGNGPDLFLLPSPGFANRTTGVVFPDVTQSMHNGMFADISALYDADTDLNKEQLQTTVMEAGVIDGARYVLPLYFSFDTLMVDSEQFSKYDIPVEDITGSVQDLFNVVLEKKDHSLAVSANPQQPRPGQYFPELFDYEAGKVLVTEEEIAAYLKLFFRSMTQIYDGQNLDTMVGGEESTQLSTTTYTTNNRFWRNISQPLHINSLDKALHAYVISRAEGLSDFAVYPLRSSDGSVTANITYWGAVSSSCDNVELAYDFLRLLLSEKVQWEIGRSKLSTGFANSLYCSGYPVRIHGSVEHLTTSVINMASYYQSPDDPEGRDERLKLLENVRLTDSDFPLLDVKIDKVRFTILWELDLTVERNFSVAYDPFSVPTDEEIDKWAKELYRELEFHIAEG